MSYYSSLRRNVLNQQTKKSFALIALTAPIFQVFLNFMHYSTYFQA